MREYVIRSAKMGEDRERLVERWNLLNMGEDKKEKENIKKCSKMGKDGRRSENTSLKFLQDGRR